MKKQTIRIIAAGLVIGAVAVALTAAGNPGNMGFCIACFLRDIAGALGLHRAEAVEYMRPEIAGLVLGSTIMALATRSFSARGGSSPVTRFVLGFFVMVGALMFLGCPLRMILRLGGGDLNALVGLAGFAGGIWVGTLCLKRGFTLKRTYILRRAEGAAFPAIMAALLLLLAAAPGLLLFSAKGPGSMHAAVLLSLLGGLVVGALAQRTRLCTVGGIRDAILLRDFNLLAGGAAIFAAVLIGNLILGKFKLGFSGQPVAHTDGLWNFLGMALVGWASVLLGGCPLRQLILAGEGNGDSAIAVIGMTAGAAMCHNFKLASSADGPTANGKIAVLIGFAVVAVIAACNLSRAPARAGAAKSAANQ